MVFYNCDLNYRPDFDFYLTRHSKHLKDESFNNITKLCCESMSSIHNVIPYGPIWTGTIKNSFKRLKEITEKNNFHKFHSFLQPASSYIRPNKNSFINEMFDINHSFEEAPVLSLVQ